MSESIEEWTSNDRLRLVIMPSGFVTIFESSENQERATPLYGNEPEELAHFIIRHAQEIRHRQQAARNEAEPLRVLFTRNNRHRIELLTDGSVSLVEPSPAGLRLITLEPDEIQVLYDFLLTHLSNIEEAANRDKFRREHGLKN